MSNTQVQVPAHIAARIAARAGQKSSIMSALLHDGFAYPKISTRASRFRLVEDGVETVVGTNLDVVVVDVNPKISKIWYSKPYDGATDVRPDCWSNDGITPDSSVEKPFHANCTACPNNILGSKITPTGAKSKICADQRHIAVVPAADPTKVYGLTVTISAFKALREYFKDLNNYGLDVKEVVTELGFDDQASYPKITFRQKKVGDVGQYVPEKAMAVIEEIAGSDEVKIATRQMEPSGNRLAAPKTAPAIAAPQQAPAAAPKPAPAPAVNAAPPAKQAEDNTAPAGGLSAMESKLAALFE